MRFAARIFALGFFSTPLVLAAPVNLLENARILATSNREKNPAYYAIDGVVSDDSRWLATIGDPAPCLEIEFPKPVKIGAIDIYTGYADEPPLQDFDISFEIDGQWQQPEGCQVEGNVGNPRRVEVAVEKVSRLKFSINARTPGRIREIAVYESKDSPKGTGLVGEKLEVFTVARDIHQIALNQIGFETARTKRFTAPLSADGTKFSVRKAKAAAVLFTGEIKNHIGDFSEFRPADSTEEYVVDLSGPPLKANTSDAFLIREDLWQEAFWQPAVDFFIDSRSVVGTHPSAYGGCPWRDGTYYDYILPALVLFYSADPERVQAMPRQIDWQADHDRVLSPNFVFDANNPNSGEALETTRRYYQELEPPKADAPDVVKLLHWGAGYYLINPETADPSGDPAGKKIHFQTVEQLAYVVWEWPKLSKWLPRSFYERCRDFCFANWDDSLGVDERWKPASYPEVERIDWKTPSSQIVTAFKGRHAPGNSIGANLMMYEVAKREGRDDADRFMNNAVAQADWIVKNLDWNDPWTTKGQRMSEHRTIPNLVWLLRSYPDKAPAGLREKIRAWAEVAIRRSDNLWDFRKYDDGDTWTIPRLNDVGNCASFPAVATAASWMVDDPDVKRRLQTMAVAHLDYLFGRNPRLAATISRPESSFPGIERGWPKQFPNDVCARLELCRGSISSSPGSEMFPFEPEAGFRHAEGWVNYGAAWCVSLAYLRFDEKLLKGEELDPKP